MSATLPGFNVAAGRLPEKTEPAAPVLSAPTTAFDAMAHDRVPARSADTPEKDRDDMIGAVPAACRNRFNEHLAAVSPFHGMIASLSANAGGAYCVPSRSRWS